ncbi:MAG: histidine kinase [Clostridia bacterium]|nr:histidine kinase [Clostridia bacterium]
MMGTQKDGDPMRLSVKIVLIFSAMMILAMLLLSSYAMDITREGSKEYTVARFHNMAENISNELQEDFTMMRMTMRDLSENSVLITALNQIVRDDSDDHKLGVRAENTAMVQFRRSPLANACDRVSFFTRDGIFLTWPELSGNDGAKAENRLNTRLDTVSAFPWLDIVENSNEPYILVPYRIPFFTAESDLVFGMAQPVRQGDRIIGCLEVDLKLSRLERLMEYTDEKDILLQVFLDDGRLLYSSVPDHLVLPEDMPQNEFVLISPENSDKQYNAYHIQLKEHGLSMTIAQDSAAITAMQETLRRNILTRALSILVPALVLITLVSIGLTRSIRKLTRKVQQVPAGRVLLGNDDEVEDFRKTVTSPTDYETHELENVFNQMMHQLREQASTEMSLREGTLQAQLSALQTQINPHFIYNTLNIISAKSMESGNFDVIEICDRFASMLRYSTDTRSRTATLAEEIENVRNYLMLAKARYENNLEYAIDVPESLNEITVPKLTLQPLVENALTHGFDGTNIIRILSVTGFVLGDSLVLEIRDNGTGFSEEMLKSLRFRIREIEDGKVSIESTGGHIGLVNTCLRLYYYSKGAMRIAISNDSGAVITMTFPAAGNEKK